MKSNSMNKLIPILSIFLSSSLFANNNWEVEKILYLDTFTYYGAKDPTVKGPFKRLHIKSTSKVLEETEQRMLDFQCNTNQIREIEITPQNKAKLGAWREVVRFSKEPLFMAYACNNKTSYGSEYKNLNQCIKEEMKREGQCSSDSECVSTVSVCQRFIPKSCYFSTFGISCTKVPSNCIQTDLGTVKCREFGDEY